jgi:hypothetical protein
MEPSSGGVKTSSAGLATVMEIWIADEIGQIKACALENVEGNTTLSLTDRRIASSLDGHDRSDFVQVMTLVKWEVSGKSMVSRPPLILWIG